MDGSRVGPLGLEGGDLGSKSCKYRIWCVGWQKSWPSWFGRWVPGQHELEIKNMVSWIARDLDLLVWKKGTLAARVENREYGVLDGGKVGPLGSEECDLGRKSVY